ncbi:MAG TPA: hypothetical protein DIU20_09670 [Cryomorphaceae bacterium]|nr:hypothetical protein [Cryomorphaceae bacterium]
MMKKLLFPTLGLIASFAVSAQEIPQLNTNANLQTMEVEESGVSYTFDNVASASKFKMPVTDTLLPIIGSCPNPFTFISSGGNIITGTFELSWGDLITDVGQILNTNGDQVDVYSLLVFTAYKDEGPSKGSFTAAIYDTTGGIGSAPLATTLPVAFDNVNDTNGIAGISDLITEFAFATPYSINAPFWGTVQVDNGSDTLSILSTPNGCGAGAIMHLSDTAWAGYGNVFTIGGAPLQIGAHIWAAVDNSNVGLDKNFISRNGLNFYPNPARDRATVEFDLPSENNLTLVIQDMSGREVYRTEQSFNAGDRQFELDLSSYAPGPYTYQVVGEKQQLNGVFIKE